MADELQPRLSRSRSVGDPRDYTSIGTEVGKAVVAYLAEHPQAMDTAEGIAEWWMKDHESRDIETVRRVLGQLTREGLLEVVGAGKYAHYRLRKSLETNRSIS